MKHRILVVAEDATVRATFARWLMAAGHTVELAESAKRARDVNENESLALAIVVPQGLGSPALDLARELRGAIGRLIVVTEPSSASGSRTVPAIDADGAIPMPLNESEVLATVAAAMPVQPNEEPSLADVLDFEGHVLDVGGRRCRTKQGEDIPLTRGEFTALLALVRQKGRVVSRDELRQAVAGRDAGPDDRSVDVMISRVRRKIEPDPKQPRIIVTVPGEGYRLAAEVAQSQDRHVSAVPALVAPDQSMIERRALDVRRPPRPHPALWIGTAAIVGIGTVLIALWLLGLEKRDAALPVLAKFDASAVPLVADLERSGLETYPSQPDFKAVAISARGYGVAVGARDPSSAQAQALDRCKAMSNTYCRLYAVGTDVVWSVKSLPLPLRSDVHDEPLEETFDPALLPLNAPTLAEGLQAYLKHEGHRALALEGVKQGIGRFYYSFGAANRATAARLAIERCVDLASSPCLLASVDGFWTIRVPKSHPILGLFMLSNEAAMSDADKQRIGPIYQQGDWRAMARSKAGGWYPIAGASSESAAVGQALEACAKHDAECHIYAISNFRVSDGDQPIVQPSGPARAQTR